ncbi:MAG TPA: type II toxin-antitoxin system prevent-host-death family antitoxin [Spirochaetota bacterium]|nr:type II toxin-antitoxin system prevent-host-death family antitoxin [Spirochaetota bacterium]HNT12715.1 type II toxin-antitoxin system prevent-host-death family antitoxin [Spirochaetota bacterium]HNV45760.1 type II toxin-antitoxin system prevent-host-death family antitoxin [Spirochaetota bacterium]HOS38153.1 type II toxin-antitoxin system prevent-host-death family antitoxin [Spirochaetota bacterium]HPI22313.1 type II toxin-antitoxin system prevent-host-death family antitoxin [Spirochaetota ba
MRVTAKDLRTHSRILLEAVARGEEVIITFRGRPRAKLVPITRTKKKADDASDVFGMWRDNPAASDVNGYVRSKRKGRYAC